MQFLPGNLSTSKNNPCNPFTNIDIIAAQDKHKATASFHEDRLCLKNMIVRHSPLGFITLMTISLPHYRVKILRESTNRSNLIYFNLLTPLPISPGWPQANCSSSVPKPKPRGSHLY